MINVGVIGVGYWGPNIVRNFVANKHTKVLSCADVNSERLSYINSLYPAIETTKDYKNIIKIL